MQQPLPKAQPINVAQVFAQALTLHQQGRLSEAEPLYSAILAARPDHVDTLEMMGLVKLAKGQPGEALQGVEDSTQRRKRAVASGRNALDALDSLKVGLLDGSVDRSTLARLKVAAEGLTEETGDAGLDAVLHEINLRLAVELAKAGAA
jgi:hypothetical protein